MPDSQLPDFQELVRKHLGELHLDSAQREEIITELAGHLEETYGRLREEGLCKSDALQRSLGEEINWRKLSRKIQSAKCEGELMNDRTKQFWLPAMVGLAISEGVSFAFGFAVASPPHLVLIGAKLIYLPWLLSMPVAGAAAAYLSRRGGSKRGTLVAASLFPAVMALCFISAGIAITLFTGAPIFARPQWFHISMALGLGVVVPAGLLLLGSAPFLKERSARA